MPIISSNNAGLKSFIPALIGADLVHGKGVLAVELSQNSSFMNDLRKAANENDLKVVSLDCATVVTLYDAIGWLRALTEQSHEDPSILVLEHITELSSRELQFALLHAWKNETNQFTDDRPEQSGDIFFVNNREYIIYLTWDEDKHDELTKIWCPGDGFAWIGNYEKWKADVINMYKNMSDEDFEKCLKLRGLIKK